LLFLIKTIYININILTTLWEKFYLYLHQKKVIVHGLLLWKNLERVYKIERIKFSILNQLLIDFGI
jgi:hypothetical protein